MAISSVIRQDTEDPQYFHVSGPRLSGRVHAQITFRTHDSFRAGRVVQEEFPSVTVTFHAAEELTVNGIQLSGFQTRAIDPASWQSDGSIRRADIMDDGKVTDAMRTAVHDIARTVTDLYGTPENVHAARLAEQRGAVVAAERLLEDAQTKLHAERLKLMALESKTHLTAAGKTYLTAGLRPATRIVGREVHRAR